MNNSYEFILIFGTKKLIWTLPKIRRFTENHPARSSFEGYPPVLLFDYHPAVGEELILGMGLGGVFKEHGSYFYLSDSWKVVGA
jgi:hypothetical protein